MNHYIIDFDSTFTQVEALDELARISLADHPDREKAYEQIEAYTNAAMEGRMSFGDSLEGRIKLLQANRHHLDLLIRHLRKKVSASFARNRIFFRQHASEVLIVSGGFKEFITPVVSRYHIPVENIYANTFIFDQQGNITGYDRENPLSGEGGKVRLLREMNLPGELYGIGDGFSDFQLKESGIISKFFAFTENIERKTVAERADHVTPNFDEFLYLRNLPRAISYPKNRIKCLILGEVPEEAAAMIAREGYNVRRKKKAEEKYLKDAGVLISDEASQPTAEQYRQAERLKTAAVFGKIGDKNIAETAAHQGIVLFDDPKHNPRNAEFLPKRVLDFMNRGTTHMSFNFPHVLPPRIAGAHRIIHIHKNVPGVMGAMNEIFARNNMNLVGQFLVTNPHIGYVISDVNAGYEKQVIDELKAIPHTIRFRLLY
ncbi:MAG: HAD-IB family phosphatase [Mucilaginibacter polytrichastri]|nr:HAD-IB family phosphatase [Mucilaginibacter polytrichastri]